MERTQNTLSNVLVTVIAVNMETRIPMASVRAKPLIEPVPKLNKIRVVMREETLESRMEDQAREKPV